ncbi:MerR family transcriptional regulator [Lacticigenium naphthae]|uniref:MerR family transcriptional regulator n=1 Tax=Lacticigenium naphthae TaxID=515351 RepID=UPI00041D89AA|nr:MerR family transcriptional regulator [Lacticigenium naphthae]
MEYTVKKIARLAGVTPRTIRHYATIQLLSPACINSSGYRLYGRNEIDRLQQILFYRELGFPLTEIKQILDDPSFDEKQALKDHYQDLLLKQKQVDQLLHTIEKTLADREGIEKMTDQEKFTGFKKEVLKANEESYGKESQETYGEETIARANKQFSQLTEGEFDRWRELEQTIIETLKAYQEKDAITAADEEILARLHHQWLTFTWSSYSKEMHRGLAEMYLADDRFTAFYDDKAGEGAARMLHGAILTYTTEK